VPADTIQFQLFFIFALAAIAFGFFLDSPRAVFEGSMRILQAPSMLLSDYFAIGNPGATFVNAGLLMLVYVLFVRWQRDQYTGPLVAALFTVFGFAFFGKNILNSLPITIGVFLWAKLERKPVENYLVAALFGTALAPLVSYITFAMGLPFWLGLLTGYAAGIIVGVIIPPLAAAFMNFHHGLSLYNVGFTAGIIGMVFVALVTLFGLEVPEVHYVSTDVDIPIAIFLIVTCLAMIVLGYHYNHNSFAGYRKFLQRSGRAPSDFFVMEGLGRTFLNMGIMGIAVTLFVLLAGGHLNGPVLGGIFTVIGFAAFGKHPGNTAPIIVGILLGALATGQSPGATGVLVVVLFGTALAPMAGVYGPLGGVVAGFLHMALVTNVAILHQGLNLYNNGFSAGFVAFILIPVFNAVYRIRNKPSPLLEL
jgi:hypothetical protein